MDHEEKENMNKVRVNKQLNGRHISFVRHYLDELPFYLTEKQILQVRKYGRFWGAFLLIASMIFIFISNITPFGATLQYAMGQHTKNIIHLYPQARITTSTINGLQVSKIHNDLVYFTTNMPFSFDTATVRFFFQNPNQDQVLSVGFQDRQKWHYNVKPIDVPFLNTLNWSRSGSDPVLYQRTANYKSPDTFMSNPPQNAIIATYAYNLKIGDMNQTRLLSYAPQKQETVINTPLRGKHTMYVYLDHEPFQMKIFKQDLNWYQGADPMKVSIYKDNELVFQEKAPDDGITDASQKILPPTQLSIASPGPQFPESGVYKVVIDASSDTFITKITTNLHKIVFGGSLFLAGNSASYPDFIASTSASTVYTNALSLSALTYHGAGEQTILVGKQFLNINMRQMPFIITPPDDLTKIFIPKNDILLNAFQGYFAFSPDQFFLPTPYHLMTITKKDDVGLADYILTDYLPSQQIDGWQENEQTFDLRTAYIKNNKLNWVIESPHLKEKNGAIMIKDIQVIFHKKAWL